MKKSKILKEISKLSGIDSLEFSSKYPDIGQWVDISPTTSKYKIFKEKAYNLLLTLRENKFWEKVKEDSNIEIDINKASKINFGNNSVYLVFDKVNHCYGNKCIPISKTIIIHHIDQLLIFKDNG